MIQDGCVAFDRTAYDAIIFDFFGVICSEIAPIWLARYLPREPAVSVKSEVVHSVDRGEISQDQMFEKLGRIVGVSPDKALREWRDLVRIDPQMVSLLEVAARRKRLALLTNSAGPFVREILDAHDFGRFFQVIVVSSEVRLAKPSPDIYRLLLQRLDMAPARAVLVDDTASNLCGAAVVGMPAFLFTSSADCRERLGF